MHFGLKTLLLVTGILCVANYLLAASPNVVATVTLIAVAVVQGALLVGAILYGGPKTRAFCIGALIPAGATVIALTWLLGIWLLAGGHDIKDTAALLEHLDRLAFTMRVWSAACWLLELLAGGMTLSVKNMLQT